MTGPNGGAEVRVLGGPIAAFTVGTAGAARMDDGKPGGWATTTTKEGSRYRAGSPRPLEHLEGGDGDVAISTPPQPADPPGTPTTAEGYARLVLAGEMHIDTAVRAWRKQIGQTTPPKGWPGASKAAQRLYATGPLTAGVGTRPWYTEANEAKRRGPVKAKLIAGTFHGESVAAAARRVGITKRTIFKWAAADREFGAAFYSARGDNRYAVSAD